MPTINKLGGAKPAPSDQRRTGSRRCEGNADDNRQRCWCGSRCGYEHHCHFDRIKGVDFKAGLSRVKVPSFLQTTMPETSERELTGYIGYASDASKHYPEQQAAGLTNGDIFLMHQGQYIKCPQLEFFLVTGESFKSVMDREGKFLFATRDLAMKEVRFKYQGKERFADNNSNPKLQPHYVCLTIVNLNGRLIPIKGDFIGTKSGGIESAISAVKAAADPKSGWLRLSEQHQTTAGFPHPFGRVYHTMRTKYEVAKTGGNSYYRTITVSSPATVAQMSVLMEGLQDESFTALLTEAHTNYTACRIHG